MPPKKCQPFWLLWLYILTYKRMEIKNQLHVLEVGNPLQYSCLENPMDRGGWRAAVHRVAKSWTRLSAHVLLMNWTLYYYKRSFFFQDGSFCPEHLFYLMQIIDFSAEFWLMLACYILFHHFVLIFVSISCVSCKQNKVRSCFLYVLRIHLLMRSFQSFTSKLVVVRNKCTVTFILFFSICPSVVCFFFSYFPHPFGFLNNSYPPIVSNLFSKLLNAQGVRKKGRAV